MVELPEGHIGHVVTALPGLIKMGSRVLGQVGSDCGGLDELLPRLIRPAQEQGWTVTVTLTPTAGRWLRESGMLAEIEQVTSFPVRVDPSPADRTQPTPTGKLLSRRSRLGQHRGQTRPGHCR